MSTTPTTRTHTARRLGTHRRVALAGLALVATGLLASCSGVGTSDAGQASPADTRAATTVAPVASPVNDPATPAPGDGAPTTPQNGSDQGGATDPGAGSNAGSSHQGGGSNQGGGSSHTPSSPAPVINSFHTPDTIDCHNGSFQTFSASWSVAGADKVTISIDGPGVYKTYPATGSDSLPFNCSSSHTFLLTAYGHDGQKATRQITLQPRNVQAPSSPSDDDQDPTTTVPAPTTTMP